MQSYLNIDWKNKQSEDIPLASGKLISNALLLASVWSLIDVHFCPMYGLTWTVTAPNIRMTTHKCPYDMLLFYSITSS